MADVKRVNIIGAGISGLSAAITLARAGIGSCLISSLPSERAQSVLAEGGINAALDTMGQHDTTQEHFEDTMRGGVYLEAESAIRGLTEHAPGIVRELVRLGVPFNSRDGQPVQRYFGGQKKMRTAFAKSSTGKMIMTALIDETRKYEAKGLITRFAHHDLTGVRVSAGSLQSLVVRDHYSGRLLSFSGPAIMCCGGLNGFFEGMTTGTTQNTGHAAALLFEAGVVFANLEMIQYHPTTVGITGKRMLISEAARGEGGRLWVTRGGKPWYFMEDKYPELGNLMPRDVISREMALLSEEPDCAGDIYLDMTAFSDDIWRDKLSDLRSEVIDYLRIDPAREPVPVSPGIHFFMGGMRVNDRHETNIRGLLAAGEAACKYHGANRLGGNSMLAAVYSGSVAAQTAAAQAEEIVPEDIAGGADAAVSLSDPGVRLKLRDTLLSGLGIVRRPEKMEQALTELKEMETSGQVSALDQARIRFGEAMMRSALERLESRGSHYRVDYPEPREEYRKQTCVKYGSDGITIRLIAADQQEETV